MNGVRRFFAAAKPSFPSGPDLSPISPSQSDSPDDAYPPSSATSSANPEPSTFSVGTQLQQNSPEVQNASPAPKNQPTSAYGVSDSLESPPNPSNSRLTSEDLPEQGSDLRSTYHTHSSSARQPTPSDFSKQSSPKMGIRDDLLLSLQTSEVIVDSRDYETLTTEEVEALKEEQRYLSSRTDAARKKLNLELKLRDVSHNLQKLNGSKARTESTEKNKLDAVNAEMIRTLEQLLRVDRRLLQHQSAVLNQSVRSLERQLNPDLNQLPNSNGTRDLSFSPKSPALTFSSSTSTPTRSKFEGAHLFAGHAQSSFPISSRHSQNTHRIQEMEMRLKAIDDAKKLVETKLVTLQEEYQQLRQQNINLEKSYEMRLSHAQNTIHDLEDKLGTSLNAELVKEQWERDKREWDDERGQLESHLAQRDLERQKWEENQRDWHTNRQGLEDSVRRQRDMIAALERSVEDLSAIRMEKEELDQLVLQKDDELQRLKKIMGQNETSWQAERIRLEDELEQARNTPPLRSHINDEVENRILAEFRDSLEELVDLHEIPHDSQDNAVLNLLSSVRNHLTSLSVSMKDVIEEKAVLEDQLRNCESELREGSENQERLRRELKEVQQTLRETMVAMRDLKSKTKELPEDIPPPDALAVEYSKIVEQLKGLWAILPSVEARAPRTPKNGPISPQPSPISFSLSDLDVRTLKTLYDPKQGFVSPYVNGQFNIEEFVRMVHALVNDDRALIERLLRFAQSHDLLRNNAERAQKLAQESSKGLEMYQMQVRSLEERNMMLTHKQLTMMDEISGLQQSLDIVTSEKDGLSATATEQALVVQRLTNVVSGRDRTRVEESPMATKASLLVKYFTEIQTKLQEAQDEIKQLRSVETSQRVALLDELNSLQQENNRLRDQLRNSK